MTRVYPRLLFRQDLKCYSTQAAPLVPTCSWNLTSLMPTRSVYRGKQSCSEEWLFPLFPLFLLSSSPFFSFSLHHPFITMSSLSLHHHVFIIIFFLPPSSSPCYLLLPSFFNFHGCNSFSSSVGACCELCLQRHAYSAIPLLRVQQHQRSIFRVHRGW